MSTTTSSDELTGEIKSHKVAIFMAFCGVGYKGMQRNHGAKTIEGDLEEALFQSKAVQEPDRCKPKQYDFARSARTDKGVSAVGQVVSGRFYIDPPGFIERLNSNLPEQIRVLGFRPVMETFSAKKCCDGRRYVYLLPVFALDVMAHRDREAVMASLGSGEEYVKCLECSERGRKVANLVGNWKGPGFNGKSLSAFGLSSVGRIQENVGKLGTKESVEKINGEVNEMAEAKDVFCSSALSSKDFSSVDGEIARIQEGGCRLDTKESVEKMNGEVNEMAEAKKKFCSSALSSEAFSSVDVEGASLRVDGCSLNTNASKELAKKINGEAENKFSALSSKALSSGDVQVARIHEDVCKLNTNSSKELVEKINGVAKSKFCYGEKEKERFNRVLNYYVGSHNFHNFTTRMVADDPAAYRHIISFTANTVVNLDGIDFIKCEVVGQSFMLHQIRKMMGLAVAIMRNCAPESLIQTAFSKDVNITVPMAPEHGLYLDECFFTSYNKRVQASHEKVSMEAYKEEAEAFKLKHIYTHIGSVERKYGNMALWLHSLNYRNYPDLNYTSNGHNTDQ